MIRELIVAYRALQCDKSQAEWAGRHAGRVPKLHPSSVGGCRRKAVLNAVDAYPDHLLHVDAAPLDDYVAELMYHGETWEAVNAPAFTSAIYHPHLETECWRGEPDFLINGTVACLVEHKDTAEHNFKIKDRLPYDFHCAQLVCYGLLWEQIHGHLPEMRLYYNGRGHYAEFLVWPNEELTIWEGQVDDRWHSGVFPLCVGAEMVALEGYWKRQEVPESHASPFAERFACTKRNRDLAYPACVYFNHCWPEYGEGPFHVEK